MSSDIWDEDGDHPSDILGEKLDAGQKLEGVEAKAFLAGHFSNATNGNYSARSLFDQAYLDFKITIEKL